MGNKNGKERLSNVKSQVDIPSSCSEYKSCGILGGWFHNTHKHPCSGWGGWYDLWLSKDIQRGPRLKNNLNSTDLIIGCWYDNGDNVTLEKNQGLRHTFEIILCREVRAGSTLLKVFHWSISEAGWGLWRTVEAGGDLAWLNSSSRKSSQVSSMALSHTFPKSLSHPIMPHITGAYSSQCEKHGERLPWKCQSSPRKHMYSKDQILGAQVVKSRLETCCLALTVLKKRDLLSTFRIQEILWNDLDLSFLKSLRTWQCCSCVPSTIMGLAAATSFGACAIQSPSSTLTLGPALFNGTCPFSTPETLV